MKRKKNPKLSKTISQVLIILLIILLLVILINLKFWKYFEKKEVEIVSLEDRCSVMFNSILHTIKDESGCENYCRAECFTRKSDFYKVEFYLSEDSCNTCNCYCK